MDNKLYYTYDILKKEYRAFNNKNNAKNYAKSRGEYLVRDEDSGETISLPVCIQKEILPMSSTSRKKGAIFNFDGMGAFLTRKI